MSTAKINAVASDLSNKAKSDKPISTFIWNARDHRKGRYPIPDDGHREKRKTKQHIVWLNWNPQNISWLVAFCFTVGSIVWCANAVLVFRTSVYPALCKTNLSHYWKFAVPEVRTDYTENVPAGAWTAWVGGTIFLFSSYLGILEALNRGSEIDFGQTVQNLHHSSETSNDKPFSSASSTSLPPYASHTKDVGILRRRQHLLLKERNSTKAHWHWFGTRWKEIGYTAAVIQQICAVIFWIAVVTGLPGCLPVELSGTALSNGVYWLPQVLGGLGFVIAPGLQMLEAQEHWWKPAIFKIGWHSAAWNCCASLPMK